MSVETIRYYEKLNALQAMEVGEQPAELTPRDIQHMFDKVERGRGRIEIPNLGSFRPSGWELVKVAFVDGGFEPFHGPTSGPAMCLADLRDWMMDVAGHNPSAGFAIVSSGQFQVCVGYFTSGVDQCPEEIHDAYAWIYEGESYDGYSEDELEAGYCPECGSVYDASEKFEYCEQCGYEHVEEDEEETDEFYS